MIIAIDIGGTKTLVALFDNGGEIVKKEEFQTNHELEIFLSELTSLVEKEFFSDQVEKIAVGVPGLINHSTETALRFGNLPWHNVPLGQILKDKFGVPIFVENDAKVAAYSEAKLLGSAPPVVMYITISTGIGTGIVYKGKLDDALSRSEVGQLMLWYDNSYHEWEEIATGRAILRDYGKYAHDIEDEDTWKEIAHKLSLGLLTIIPTLYPDVIIFGGSVGTYFDRYSSFLQKEISEHLTEMIEMPKLLKAHHTEEAVIYGCYELATDSPHPHSHTS